MGGTMDEASIFRWVPSMYSMTPSFKLNIRQNHFTGSAKKLHQEARKQKMQANIPVPAFTNIGMNAHDFHDDHYEEEFEFDLNLIDGLKVELCTPAMVTDVSAKLQSLNQALPPGKAFGRISFTVKKRERPMHRRPLCGLFTLNTTQAKFAGAVRSLKKYSIFVNLTKPYLLKAFNCYKDVILAGRQDIITHIQANRRHCTPVTITSETLATAQIVGCTAFVATTLANTDYEPDILIFDKAGQAINPDLMIALLGNITRLKKVILNGDPAQLPPVEVYPHFSRIELKENYCGHHSTFAASSNIFYDGRMMPGGDLAQWNTTLATNVHQLLSNQDLAGAYHDRNAAIDPENRQLFVNVPGISEPEPNGTSYYKHNGVMTTAIFVQMLVDSGVKPKDIGIISMYSEYVRHIRQELANRGIEGAEVSTVDGYQGSEKEVMVFHFVAAFPDRQDPFAFVKRPQRLNVASTRARQYQFLIGNMDCWMHWQRNLPVSAPSTDKMREFMAWIHEKGQIMDWVQVDKRRYR
ncbi:hypothetical protein LTR56_013592 [Elasticomyces elasticus]|nr:hypothetical protein LTR56_013592 [Elasticomyces elasticus]KAK3651056.1 hypothetical protein LTR22_012304 [Elasticomyces elasticus]KAK5765602.1 hypothetical protein LTS12_004354 [Elasticomyces elasticus]